MTEPAQRPQANGSARREQNGEERPTDDRLNNQTAPARPGRENNNNFRPNMPDNFPEEVPLDLQNPYIQIQPLPPPMFTTARVVKYLVSTVLLIGLFAICLHVQREYYINQLLKYAPSPSPFSKDDAPTSRQGKEEQEPDSEVISIKYQPPSDVLQKIPFLRKSEEEIYADQMKQVMWSLREAVKRMDRGGNETQLAGVITMKPNDKPEDEVSVRGLDSKEDGTSEDRIAGSKTAVKDLVKRLTSALSEIKQPKKPEVPSVKPEEDPIPAIMKYRKEYFQRDKELARLLSEPGANRNATLTDEADQRDAIRRKLILRLIDHFFATETDDDARIEKAYHYAMTDAERYERQIRLETEIFGPEDLAGGGPDVIFGPYRKQMGYVYDQSLKTFVNGSQVQKLEKLEIRERKGFYSEMKILLKLERRIKAKVVKYAKRHTEL